MDLGKVGRIIVVSLLTPGLLLLDIGKIMFNNDPQELYLPRLWYWAMTGEQKL
jgi:hypothetical protein